MATAAVLPALVSIEEYLLSPEDTFSRTMVKCRDYLDMGVPEVWMFDPEEHIAFIITQQGTSEYRAGTLKLSGTQVAVSLDDVFAAIDEGR